MASPGDGRTIAEMCMELLEAQKQQDVIQTQSDGGRRHDVHRLPIAPLITVVDDANESISPSSAPPASSQHNRKHQSSTKPQTYSISNGKPQAHSVSQRALKSNNYEETKFSDNNDTTRGVKRDHRHQSGERKGVRRAATSQRMSSKNSSYMSPGGLRSSRSDMIRPTSGSRRELPSSEAKSARGNRFTRKQSSNIRVYSQSESGGPPYGGQHTKSFRALLGSPEPSGRVGRAISSPPAFDNANQQATSTSEEDAKTFVDEVERVDRNERGNKLKKSRDGLKSPSTTVISTKSQPNGSEGPAEVMRENTSRPPSPTKALLSVPRAPPDPSSSSDEEEIKFNPHANLEKRKNVINELIETERNYCNGLRKLKDYYKQPLLRENIIPPDDVQAIFSTFLQSLHLASVACLKRLEALANVDESVTPCEIGNILLDTTDEGFIKSYTSYITNYESSRQAYLKQVKQNPKFAKFIKETEKREELNHKTFEDFLITAIQRLPQYIMLVGDLIKYTPSDHIDYKRLLKAQKKLKGITAAINAKKKKKENKAKLRQIYHDLDIKDDIEKDQQFIFEDDIFSNPISESNTNNKEQTIHLYLLSDRILIAKRKEQNELKVKRLPPDTNYQPNLPDEGPTAFKLGSKIYHSANKAKHEKFRTAMKQVQQYHTWNKKS